MNKVLLEPKDIPPGSYIRYSKDWPIWAWRHIECVQPEGIYIIDGSTNNNIILLKWEHLMDSLIYHPIIYPNWKKCYKIDHGNEIIEHPDAHD